MIEHRTKAWYDARLGKFTASSFPDIMAKPRDKNAQLSKSALSCIEQLARETYFGKPVVFPDSDSTRWGLRHEERALKEFSSNMNFEIEDVGFLLHPTIRSVGATPDALVTVHDQAEEHILVQVKCPFNQKYHRRYCQVVRDNASLRKCRSAYYWQMQGEMWVTGAEANYFVSFDPREDWSEDRILVAKILRDDKAIQELEKQVLKAIEVKEIFLYEFQRMNITPLSIKIYDYVAEKYKL